MKTKCPGCNRVLIDDDERLCASCLEDECDETPGRTEEDLDDDEDARPRLTRSEDDLATEELA